MSEMLSNLDLKKAWTRFKASLLIFLTNFFKISWKYGSSLNVDVDLILSSSETTKSKALLRLLFCSLGVNFFF